jgi:hypothetical protein
MNKVDFDSTCIWQKDLKTTPVHRGKALSNPPISTSRHDQAIALALCRAMRSRGGWAGFTTIVRDAITVGVPDCVQTQQ